MRSTAWTFARRELRVGLKGFRIFLACLALGVAAIAGSGSVADGVRAGLQQDAQRLLGGDLEFRLTYRGATDAELAALRAEGRVSALIEMRAMAAAPGSGERTLVELKGVDDAYPLYGALGLDPDRPADAALAKRDGTWGAAADPVLLERLGLSLGDTIRLGQLTVTLRATIAREPDDAASVFAFGPRLMVARQAVAETGLVQRGSLVRHVYRLRLPETAEPSAVRARLEDRFPDAGWRIRGLDRAAPGIERFIDRMALFLTLVGLSALLVGGIGVANGVRAYLDGRARTIAILKCLGAPSVLVFRVYLIQVGLLALAGIVIGLLLGAAAPFVVAGLLSGLLPVELKTGIYPLPLLVAAAFGLLTALAFSLWPLARARDIPGAAMMRGPIALSARWPRPRYIVMLGLTAAALAGLTVASADRPDIAGGFVIGALIALALFRLAGWAVQASARRISASGMIGTGRPRLRLALGNLHRPGSPTPSVVLSLGLGLTTLLTIALIEGNLTRQIADRLPEEAPAFFFIDIQPEQRDGFVETVNGIDGARVVDVADMVRGRITHIDGRPVEEVDVAPDAQWAVRGDRGLTSAARRPDNARLTAGDWWPEDHAGPPLASVDAGIAKGFGVGVGDTITINVLGRGVTVEIANLREIDWGNLSMNFTFVLSPSALEGAPRQFIATVKADPAVEATVERRTSAAFPNVSAIRVRDALQSVSDILRNAGTAIRATAVITLVAGALVLAGAIAAGHRRRVYESVVLKVLGARRPDLLRAYVLEYGLLGLGTGLVATVLGSMAAWWVLTRAMRSDFVFLPDVALMTVGGCIVATLAAGFAGTWAALGAKPARFLRNE